MNPISLARLLRLASPALPVGAYSYSDALEWVVEQGIVSDEMSAQRWIRSLLLGNLARFELAVLATLYRAWTADDLPAVANVNADYVAARETSELRAATLQMGAALRAALLAGGEFGEASVLRLAAVEQLSFPAAFAFAAASWSIAERETLVGYAWSWAENQVMAAIKLVPLGQSAGQRILAHLTPHIESAVETALTLDEASWSNFAPLYAIASSRHETQYTRLFRS
ncbi:MAG: urease accessory protein UreF [Burkholderiales bacterium]